VGATLLKARLLGVVENLLWTGNREPVHELCFVMSGDLAESGFSEPGWSGLVLDTGQPLTWPPETDLRDGSTPFHPAAVLDLIGAGGGRRRSSSAQG